MRNIDKGFIEIKCDDREYFVEWSEEDQEYVGICVQFPSLSHLAGDPNEALRGILELVASIG